MPKSVKRMLDLPLKLNKLLPPPRPPLKLKLPKRLQQRH